MRESTMRIRVVVKITYYLHVQIILRYLLDGCLYCMGHAFIASMDKSLHFLKILTNLTFQQIHAADTIIFLLTHKEV